MSSRLLAEISKWRLSELSREEQLWLIEYLAQNLRTRSQASQKHSDEAMATMAADPDIQREIQAIEDEFSGTESDGLEKY